MNDKGNKYFKKGEKDKLKRINQSTLMIQDDKIINTNNKNNSKNSILVNKNLDKLMDSIDNKLKQIKNNPLINQKIQPNIPLN